MTDRRRLTGREIALLRYLARVSGFVRLSEASRQTIVPLWRRGIVNVLNLKVPGVGIQGPYFQLSSAGRDLAQKFVKSDAGAARSRPPSSSRASARATSFNNGEHHE